jgi:hypothetical protein
MSLIIILLTLMEDKVSSPLNLNKKLGSPWDDGIVVEEPNDVLVDASHEGSPDDDHMLALSEEMVKTFFFTGGFF